MTLIGLRQKATKCEPLEKLKLSN